jgi:hypothetical protein
MRGKLAMFAELAGQFQQPKAIQERERRASSLMLSDPVCSLIARGEVFAATSRTLVQPR